MKAFVLYRPNNEYARQVEEWVSDFQARSGKPMQLLSVDTPEGVQYAELYDILEYPAVVVARSDGSLAKDWIGPQLPLVNDVAGYLVEQ